MIRGKTVGVVVPAYNEEGFIGEVIDTMPDYVDRVYVVDDGSTDGTWDEIQRHVSHLPAKKKRAPGDTRFDCRFVPIQHEENRGAGAALKTGYKRALADEIEVTAVMAGDAQMDPEILHRFLEPIVAGEVDYTKGNRLYHAQLREEMPFVRFVGSLALTFLTRIASGYWTMRDSQNGYTAISLEALQAIELDELVEGFGTPNELLTRLNANDMRIADVPMAANYGDEDSHIQYRSYIFWMSLLLSRNFLWRLKRKYPIYRLHPLPVCYLTGIAGLAGGSLLGVYSMWTWLVSPGTLENVLSPLIILLGGFVFLSAMVLDKRMNSHLEVQLTTPQVEQTP